MSKPVLAVVVCTLLALVALPWVPKRMAQNYRTEVTSPTESDAMNRRAPVVVGDWYFIEENEERPWTWIWDRGRADAVPASEFEFEVRPVGAIPMRGLLVDWPAMVRQVCVMLLLFGGLLTFVVRRERRREAAA